MTFIVSFRRFWFEHSLKQSIMLQSILIGFIFCFLALQCDRWHQNEKILDENNSKTRLTSKVNVAFAFALYIFFSFSFFKMKRNKKFKKKRELIFIFYFEDNRFITENNNNNNIE